MTGLDTRVSVFNAVQLTAGKGGNNQVSASGGMDKENMIHPHNGISLSHKKERHSDTWYNMDGP
jgi:hypothetical protein